MNRKVIETSGVLLSIILLVAYGIMVVNAQESQTQAGYTVFLPGVFKFPAQGHSIAGLVVNQQNIPMSGVTIRTDQGQFTTTDQNGAYSLTGLKDGKYIVTPVFGNAVFSPASVDVVLPPDVSQLNFTIQVSCAQAIVNGGFEVDSSWDIPQTAYPAGYTTTEAHSGSQSMRTGIISLANNTSSYSSARQKVSLPSGTSSAYLTFWIKPFSGSVQGLALPQEPVEGSQLNEIQLSGDVQYVLILDTNGNTLRTLVWQLSDSRTWTKFDFNLAAYAGQTIWLHFGTYNDGANSVASMFVDDVSLNICPGSSSPTPTPTPGVCTNSFLNPGFETTSAWEIPYTAYPAGYSTAQAHSGSRSMRTGILNSADNVYSYSDFRQSVSIPSGATAATARFWLYTLSPGVTTLAQPEMIAPTGRPFSETPMSGDVQYVLVLDQSKNWIGTLVWQLKDDGYWHYYEFDLRQYAGHTIYLQFGTYNDGLSGITSMFVDDASLDNCLPTPSPSPTPTATPTPAPCQELVVNNKFEGTNGWVILDTGYRAGYSTARYQSPSHSMRTGIVNSADNILSYSDFRQVVTIPSSTHHVTLGMWAYFSSSDLLSLSQPEVISPTGNPFSDTTLSDDVQYLLVLDRDQNWIGTLVWQRSNSQVWTNMSFDLSKYAGQQIMLQWGTFNNGTSGVTSMYVDDVTLQACP